MTVDVTNTPEALDDGAAAPQDRLRSPVLSAKAIDEITTLCRISEQEQLTRFVGDAIACYLKLIDLAHNGYRLMGEHHETKDRLSLVMPFEMQRAPAPAQDVKAPEEEAAQ